MTWLGALLLVAAFVALFRLLRVAARTRRALRCSRLALRLLRDPARDARSKERLARALSLRLLRRSATALLATAAAALVPLGLVVLLGDLGLLHPGPVLRLSAAPAAVFAALALCLGTALVPPRPRP